MIANLVDLRRVERARHDVVEVVEPLVAHAGILVDRPVLLHPLDRLLHARIALVELRRAHRENRSVCHRAVCPERDLALRVRLGSTLRSAVVVRSAARIRPFLLHQVLDKRKRLVPVEVDALAALAKLLERGRLRHRGERVRRVGEIGVAAARNLVVPEAASHRVVARELRRGDILARLQKRRGRSELRVKKRGEAHGCVVVAEPRAAAARFRDIEAAVIALRTEDELRRLLLRLDDRLARVSAAAERPEGERRQGRHLCIGEMAVRLLVCEQELCALRNRRLNRRNVRKGNPRNQRNHNAAYKFLHIRLLGLNSSAW